MADILKLTTFSMLQNYARKNSVIKLAVNIVRNIYERHFYGGLKFCTYISHSKKTRKYSYQEAKFFFCVHVH